MVISSKQIVVNIIYRTMQHVGNQAKGKSQNGCFKKTKHVKFSENKVSYPMIRTRTYDTHTYVSRGKKGGKKFLFFQKFGVLCFLGTPVLRLDFLPYYQRTNILIKRLFLTSCFQELLPNF